MPIVFEEAIKYTLKLIDKNRKISTCKYRLDSEALGSIPISCNTCSDSDPISHWPTSGFTYEIRVVMMREIKLTDLAPAPVKSGLAPTYPVNPTYGMAYVEMR